MKHSLLNVKKTKNAKSSIRFVEAAIWLKKQKWSYDPMELDQTTAHESGKITH